MLLQELQPYPYLRHNYNQVILFFNGETWLLTFSQGTLAQKYFGFFSPSDVQSATSDNSRTTKSFSIDVEYDNQKCNYPITGTTADKPIFDVERKTWTCFFNPSKSDALEKTGFSEILYYGKYFGLECFGIGYNTKSPVGNINSPDLQSEFEISITAGTESASRKFNTLSGTTQGSIGNFAVAQWQGNLVSGKSCPDKDPYIPIYINGNWRIGDKSSYDVYKSLVVSSPSSDRDSQDIWLNNLKNSITKAKQSKVFGTIESQFSLNNAQIGITLTNPIQFPLTTLYIKADTIGIFTPTPEIRLFSPSSDCFKTGETGSIEIGLENIGEESGSWNIFAECQSPFTSTRNIQVSLNPGEKVTRLIPLSASANQEVRSSCTIFAESPAGTKSISVNTCVKPQITCQANQKFCDVSGTNEVIKECSSDGATSEIIQICSQGTYCEDAQCRVGDKLPEEGFFSRIGTSISNFFKQFFNFTLDIIFWLKIILLTGTLLFGFFFIEDIFDNIKPIDKRKGLSFILSGIVTIGLGLLISFILFTFLFWIVIGGLIVFLLVTRFFKK